MSRRCAVVALAAILAALSADEAWAHAGLRASTPASGAALGDTPKAVQLTFWEKPEASLSEIRILDTSGRAYQVGQARAVAGSPLSLVVPVRPLERGVYTVSWRTVSSVDGHATAGAFAFGVRVKPTGVAWAAAGASAAASPLEVIGRWLLVVGLVLLLGAAAATVGRFGGPSDRTLGALGWLLAVAGLVLLAAAQRRNAGVSAAALWHTAIGRALLARGLALAAAGGALFAAGSSRARTRRLAMLAAVISAVSAMAVHSAAGHAAAVTRMPAAHVAAQWAHIAAVGLWLGGLSALLLGLRGAPSPEKAAAVRRFSGLAGAALLVVVVTGVWRTLDGLSSWRDLTTTGYGRAVAVKSVLLLAIAALGAINRWCSVPAAVTTLRPLRRIASGELALAAGALGAAAILGALPPPASGFGAPTEIEVSGTDFGTTVRVRLTTASDQPGPNRFTARVLDYDSNAPLPAKRVSLAFTPLDDPGVVPTSLPLEPAADHSWQGSGANLAFDGRWRIVMRIERDRDSVEVPLDLEARIPPQFVSVERAPGGAPRYTVEVGTEGYVVFSPDPERPGPSQLSVTCFDTVGDERPIEQIVITTEAGDGPARPRPVRRLGPNRFVAGVELAPGRNRIVAITRAIDGTRLRAEVAIEVPAR
jgi:copper transport protein